jgi:hypothetical protein
MRRDLSTRLVKAGRFSVVFEPRDLWVGVFAGPDAAYVALLPCLVVRRARRSPVSRDLSTRLFRCGRFSVVFEPRDAWVGGYVGPKAVYVVLVPCVAFRWARQDGRSARESAGNSGLTPHRRQD